MAENQRLNAVVFSDYPADQDFVWVHFREIEFGHIASICISGESCGLDAIPPATLRQMIREAIERHIDHEQLSYVRMVEVSRKAAIYRHVERFWYY